MWKIENEYGTFEGEDEKAAKVLMHAAKRIAKAAEKVESRKQASAGRRARVTGFMVLDAVHAVSLELENAKLPEDWEYFRTGEPNGPVCSDTLPGESRDIITYLFPATDRMGHWTPGTEQDGYALMGHVIDSEHGNAIALFIDPGTDADWEVYVPGVLENETVLVRMHSLDLTHFAELIEKADTTIAIGDAIE